MYQDIEKLKVSLQRSGLSIYFQKVYQEFPGEDGQIALAVFERNKKPMSPNVWGQWQQKISDLLWDAGFELYEVRY